jgi:anaerobic selenocysteine-containing dehydrogenase/nitrite reductase/ring-hydroxylating ferredoxin subunit
MWTRTPDELLGATPLAPIPLVDEDGNTVAFALRIVGKRPVNGFALPDGSHVVGFRNVCPHMRCALLPRNGVAAAPLDEEVVRCKCHGSAFDVMLDGLVVTGPATERLLALEIAEQDDLIAFRDPGSGSGSAEGSVHATGCQYCAVGCGYNAVLAEDPPAEDHATPIVSSSMRGRVRFKGTTWHAAVAPDARCDLNKGNHSVRGGSQGLNLVDADRADRSSRERLDTPQVRTRSGWRSLNWSDAYGLLAKLVVDATGISASQGKIHVDRPEALGVKLYEYQYLENTYAATKLFYSAIGTPNVAYHDRPSSAGSSPGMRDAGMRPHDFSYEDVREADLLLFAGTNPYENQSVFFMQYAVGKEMIVLDPRRTPTAEYAKRTGGLHLQPARLGADSLVLYALARGVIEHRGNGFAPERIGDPNGLSPEREDWDGRRQKSRVTDFEGFKAFLGVGQDGGTYSLENASAVSGIPDADLVDAVQRLSSRARVGLLYEKGLIWGFNYHNTSAIASLGVLLGSYGAAGRFTGRVGGHQKGWAEARGRLDSFAGSTGNGYPMERGSDWYGDSALGPDPIRVRHNLDNHVFGPLEEEDEDQTGVPDESVRLRTGLVCPRKPDVRLLWIIGGNYFGQTNDAARKRGRLASRRENGEPELLYPPDDASVADLADFYHTRMENGGLVAVQQEIFRNPSTEDCDLLLPAAGWGEDTFTRYNAQRRMRVFERFQDMPLHELDREGLAEGDDPYPNAIAWPPSHGFRHTPKPDWAIFRDAARAIAAESAARAGDAAVAMAVEADFSWTSVGALANEMAEKSHRAPEQGGLGLEHLRSAAQANAHRSIHELLGAGGGGLTSLFYRLENDIFSPAGDIGKAPVDSELYGNGVATNGIFLPLRMDGDALVGRGRKIQPPVAGGYFFVRAPWAEIEWAFERCNSRFDDPRAVVLTNGRFNFLWNNLFHHIRNDYVSERYPEDLPGTVLELNPTWASRLEVGIANGRVVEVQSGGGSFRAVASLQPSVASGSAFALFSYPVRASEPRSFGYEGYANNATDGYADGINPIAALKYAHARIVPLDDPEQPGTPWIYTSHSRLGPSHAARSALGPKSWEGLDRLSWEVRELIVTKGLPRASEHIFTEIGSRDLAELFLEPDSLLELLRGTSEDAAVARRRLYRWTRPRADGSRMSWTHDGALLDTWLDADHDIVKRFYEALREADDD